MSTSEDITRVWVRGKGLLMHGRPRPSRFSFFVCTTMAFSLACGFLGGFATAFLTLNENYSSVYENLLDELEVARKGVEQEKKAFVSLQRQAEIKNWATKEQPKLTQKMHDRAIYSVFKDSVSFLQKKDIENGCAMLNNIILLGGYDGPWRAKALYLFGKNCSNIKL